MVSDRFSHCIGEYAAKKRQCDELMQIVALLFCMNTIVVTFTDQVAEIMKECRYDQFRWLIIFFGEQRALQSMIELRYGLAPVLSLPSCRQQMQDVFNR